MAPKAEKKPAKKVAKKVAGGKGKKGKSKVESFKIYIYKVLKQVSSVQPLAFGIASVLRLVLWQNDITAMQWCVQSSALPLCASAHVCLLTSLLNDAGAP